MSWFRPAQGKDSFYYELLERGAANAVRAAGLLGQLVDSCPECDELQREILKCEQEGDRVTHEIIRRLNTAGKSPIPQEQMHALATALDDVVDLTEQVADSFVLYRIEAAMEQAHELARVLASSTHELQQAVRALRSPVDLPDRLVAIHELENEGDRISRSAVAALFAGGIDPMVVIRWKDIFEQLEQAIDACETVAHLLESASLAGAQ